jgi:hypothetical protein
MARETSAGAPTAMNDCIRHRSTFLEVNQDHFALILAGQSAADIVDTTTRQDDSSAENVDDAQ